ncbi:AEC family transporter [Caballeronia sp. M23-90]
MHCVLGEVGEVGGVVAACLISLVKLFFYPLLTWLVLKYVLKLEPFWVQAGVLIASLPSAGNIYVLAQRYDADPPRVSAAILLSTIASVGTFPCAAWLVLR